MFFKSKKGEAKMISVYWFIILILVAVGIVVMVNLFYNSPYDVREVEANILLENVVGCISDGKRINPDLHSGVFREDFRDFFLENCDITFDVEKEWEEVQYYFEVLFYEGTVLKNPDFEISKGNPNWKKDCEFDSKKNDKIVSCVEKQFLLLDENDKIYTIKLLSMVRKTEQNVK